MSAVLDVVWSREGSLFCPVIVGTTTSAIVLQTDPKRTSETTRKWAFDLRTGERLDTLPEGHAPLVPPPKALEGGAEIRVAKRPAGEGQPKAKVIKDVELRAPSCEGFVILSKPDAKPFVAGRIGGAFHVESVPGTQPDARGNKHHTEHLVMTLCRANGPVVTFPLPWWIGGYEPDPRQLMSWRAAVCMRARVLVILSTTAYWFSLDALEQLLADAADGAPLTLRPVHFSPLTAKRTALETKLTVLAQSTAEDPVQALSKLLGWTQADFEREGQSLVLTERAAELLAHALR